MTSHIKVELPAHIVRLAGTSPTVELAIDMASGGPVTQRAILDALEARFPQLEGTLRDHTTKLRRPFIRFFACREDLSHLAPDDPLPPAIRDGKEPFLIVGAVAGG